MTAIEGRRNEKWRPLFREDVGKITQKTLTDIIENVETKVKAIMGRNNCSRAVAADRLGDQGVYTKDAAPKTGIVYNIKYDPRTKKFEWKSGRRTKQKIVDRRKVAKDRRSKEETAVQ